MAILMLIFIIDMNVPTRSAFLTSLGLSGGHQNIVFLHPNLYARIFGIEQDAAWINWTILLYFAIS